jgi:hypothetical protein
LLAGGAGFEVEGHVPEPIDRAVVQLMASATLQFPFLDIPTAQAAGNSPL